MLNESTHKREEAGAQMIEIIVLIVLLGRIGGMARRRGRRPSQFGLVLVVGWFGGEITGAALGYFVSHDAAGSPGVLVLYGLALGGAAVGAGLAFLYARSVGPIGGEWQDLATLPVHCSRLWGGVAGGVGGGVLGVLVAYFMYGGEQTEGNAPIVLQAFLAVGLLGALLGLVTGVEKG